MKRVCAIGIARRNCADSGPRKRDGGIVTGRQQIWAARLLITHESCYLVARQYEQVAHDLRECVQSALCAAFVLIQGPKSATAGLSGGRQKRWISGGRSGVWRTWMDIKKQDAHARLKHKISGCSKDIVGRCDGDLASRRPSAWGRDVVENSRGARAARLRRPHGVMCEGGI